MKTQRTTNQSGLVSIIVTVIIMMILSLLVIGFAKLVRRDQTQTLDRQLNTQALYAAETGVNDITDLIERNNGSIPAKTDCDNSTAPYTTLNPVIDAASNTSYSCVLVDPNPESAIFGSADPYTSTIVPVTTVANMSAIWVYWGVSSAVCARSSSAPAAHQLPSSGDWDCENGMLRIDIIPGNRINSRANMISNTMTFFTYPTTTGSGAITYNVANTGAKADGLCSGVALNGRNCRLRISGLSFNSYFLRIQPIYRSTSLEVSGRVSGIAQPLQNVQAIVDVTGKANDVLKRLQVRVPLQTFANAANYPLQIGATLCKDLSVIEDTANGVFSNSPDECPSNN